jgi:glycosyltransferase involved in cell wall biosynthesis
MRILFVHQNFPAQYKHLAPALAARGHEVVALTRRAQVPPLPGVRVERYELNRGNTKGVHPWALPFESKTVHAEAAGAGAFHLKEAGFTPDVICAHPGWGETLALKDVFPTARLLSYCEFYYHAHGVDVNFDMEFSKPSWSYDAWVRIKNADKLLAMECADRGISPTEWQKSTHPEWFRPKIEVIHDGIDTAAIAPDPAATLTLKEKGLALRPGDEVVTFVNRNLEPYRGYHIFMRALPEILRRRPKARVILVGGTKTGYGSNPPAGTTWRDHFLKEVVGEIDMGRVHFVGNIPYDAFLSLLRISAAHVYLTYPFVLSWSLLEAMSAGAMVIGSATPPVQEVIEHGRNGWLVDFFDPPRLAASVVEALANPGATQPLRRAARETILERFDLERVCLPRQVGLVEELGMET